MIALPCCPLRSIHSAAFELVRLSSSEPSFSWIPSFLPGAAHVGLAFFPRFKFRLHLPTPHHLSSSTSPGPTRHHCVTLEGRYMSPGDRSAHMSTLRLCTQAIDRLHPELQKLFRHLVQDPETALFAAEIAQKNQP